MRILFFTSAIVLVSLSVLAVRTLPEQRSHVPLMYWCTDPNPARGAQTATYEQWLVDNGYPPINLKVDSHNMGMMKVIIQSVNGIGSEIIDVGGLQLRPYVAAGVLLDVTELADRYDFGLDQTYGAVQEDIIVDGRQYAFPCNVTGRPLTINRALLEREGLPLPKFEWTWDEFLQWALKVRKLDDKGNTTRYAIMPFDVKAIWLTNGGTIFNETLTRCVIDSPQVAEATRYYYDLMFKYKVMPTPVDIDSMGARGLYGGSALHFLGNELVLAVRIGRYGQIRLRSFKAFAPDVALMPHKLIPLQFAYARASAVNACADDPERVARFLQFLADEPYNRLIIHDADALPPNPRMANEVAFLTPKDFPNEHGVHEKWFRAAADYGVSREYSPFVNAMIVERIITKFKSGIESQAISIEQALRGMTDEINKELERTIDRDSSLRRRFELATARQDELDRMKTQHQTIPSDRIDNVVLRRLAEEGL